MIGAMTKPQRICLVLLKHCAAVTQSALHSYHLKTALMWVCETRPLALWTWEDMLESMEAVLDFLQECIERLVLPCYFCPDINLWHKEKPGEKLHTRGRKHLDWYAVVKLRLLVPRAIQLLLAGLLSSSQAPLMRHLLGLPLDAQQFLWCCWKRSVDDPAPPSAATSLLSRGVIRPSDSAENTLYPHAVEGRLWSERFLDTFRWEKLPARCKEPAWFAEHGLDTDSEGEEEPDSEDQDSDSEGEEDPDSEDQDSDSEGEEGPDSEDQDSDSEGEEGADSEDQDWDSQGEEDPDSEDQDSDSEGEEGSDSEDQDSDSEGEEDPDSEDQDSDSEDKGIGEVVIARTRRTQAVRREGGL